MRFYAQKSIGESVSKVGKIPGNDPERSWKSAPEQPNMMHSNMIIGGAPGSGADFAMIGAHARAARSAWVGSKLKSFYESLVRKFELAGPAEKENYLAATQKLAELEQRIRRFEHMRSQDC